MAIMKIINFFDDLDFHVNNMHWLLDMNKKAYVF